MAGLWNRHMHSFFRLSKGIWLRSTRTFLDGLQPTSPLGSSMCVYNGVSSTMLPVKSGVPQRSVIGPLLFIFYVNDITTTPLSSGTLSFFADDLLLYRPIRSAAVPTLAGWCWKLSTWVPLCTAYRARWTLQYCRNLRLVLGLQPELAICKLIHPHDFVELGYNSSWKQGSQKTRVPIYRAQCSDKEFVEIRHSTEDYNYLFHISKCFCSIR